jgi:type II secretory pathway component PulM
VSITSRDRKIVAILVALAIAAGYWFLLLSPKREEVAKVQEEVTTQQKRLDAAQAEIARLEQAKTTYAADYASVVHLGKAIPQTVDTASLLIQLQDAADGTGISFDSITAGDRLPIVTASAAAAAKPKSLGKAAAEQTGQVAPGNQPSAAAAGGPAGEVAAAREDTPAAREAAAAGQTQAFGALEGVPLTFSFKGSFYGLADFFHRVKRFVQVAGDDIEISGRLLTIDKLTLAAETNFPNVEAELGATAYLTPKAEGATGGATASGPAAPASGSTTTAPAPSAPSTPAAAVTR